MTKGDVCLLHIVAHATSKFICFFIVLLTVVVDYIGCDSRIVNAVHNLSTHWSMPSIREQTARMEFCNGTNTKVQKAMIG